MKKTLVHLLLQLTRLLLLGMILSACAPKALQGTSTVKVVTPIASPSPETSKTEILPAETPTVPPDLPSAKPPAIAPAEVISPENADRVVEVAGWGKGYPFDINTDQVHIIGGLLVQK